MKSLLLISRCPPYPLHLGDRLIVYHLARELSQRGWAIDLMAYAQWDNDWTERGLYQHLFRSTQLYREPKRALTDYMRRIVQPSKHFPERAEDSWSPQFWGDIQERVKQTRYDVIHLFGGVQVYEFFGALDGQLAIITPYESYSLYLKRLVTAQSSKMRQKVQSVLQQRVAGEFEKQMFARYARVVVLAKPDKDELLRLNPALKVEVIPNGIDISSFRYAGGAREPATLLFTGNYEYAPNVDAALRLATDIFPRVREVLPHAQLRLVGNAPPPALLAMQSSHIVVTGWVPDLWPYLARATVFVCPLRIGAGIKNKILEALAVGIPVVATPLSMDGIDVRTEYSALIADDDQLANAVIRLLKDRDLQARLSVNGRQLVESRYNWSGVATAYERLYASVNGV